MKNRDKAQEIANKLKKYYGNPQYEMRDENWSVYECYQSAMQAMEWKDSKIRDILFSYTKWLDKRGFFREDLQCDFEHQIDTFREMNKEK